MRTLQLVRTAHAPPELIDRHASVVRCVRSGEMSINVIAIRTRFCVTRRLRRLDSCSGSDRKRERSGGKDVLRGDQRTTATTAFPVS